MNVLVISLTRFGDLLQTQPVLSGLAAQGHRTGLLCLENFAPAAWLLRGLDHVRPLRGGRLLARLSAGDWRGGLGELHDLLAALRRDFPPDVCVNLTPSLSARLLARSVAAPEVRGFAVDAHGFNADSSAWAAFLQLASANRGTSPFNVVDLFQRAAGLHPSGRPLELLPPGEAEAAEARELLEAARPAGARGFAALQLGASEDRRRWPVAAFAELAARLWREHGRVPVLLGTASEKALAGRFLAQAGDTPCLDLTGRTALPLLAAVLQATDLLVTNDTGTMHLAAGLGVPVVAIFLATAQPVDTGPYRPGCLCLEPDLDCHPCGFGRVCARDEACRGAVPVAAVLACAASLLDGRPPTDVAGARVWRTAFDADGFLSLTSLTGHGDSERARWIAAQRVLYRRFLDGEARAEWVGPRPALGPQTTAALRGPLAEAEGLARLLAQQMALLARDPRPAFKSKFIANCQRLQTALEGEPRLAVLGALWLFQSQQAARDLAELVGLIDRFGALLAALQDLLD